MAIQLIDSDFRETSSSIGSLQSPFAFTEEMEETSNLLMLKGIKQFIDSLLYTKFGYLGEEDRTRIYYKYFYKFIPGIGYYLPWNEQEIIIEEVKSPSVTGTYKEIQQPLLQRTKNYPKVTEGIFEFCDNEFHKVLKNLFIKEVSDIPEVISAYVIYSKNVIDLWTIVESNLYEAEGKIIDLELKILELFPNKSFDFLVLPKSSIDLTKIIPSKSIEIYRRK